MMVGKTHTKHFAWQRSSSPYPVGNPTDRSGCHFLDTQDAGIRTQKQVKDPSDRWFSGPVLPRENHVFDATTRKTRGMKMMDVMTPPDVVTPDQQPARLAARWEIVRRVEQGMTAREARLSSPIPMHRTTVYRLLRRAEREGEQALAERRHGHPVKLRGEVRTWVLEYCQGHAAASSSELQRLVAERFRLAVSVSQLNRVRAAHGLSRQAPPREKNVENGPHDLLKIP